MKRILMAVALAFVLSSTALAGDMPAVGPSPAPGQTDGPPSPVVAEQGIDSTAPADIPTCGLSVVVTLLDLAF